MDKEKKAFNFIIADHLRTTIFALADGAEIEKKGRGFILKKLIKRSCLLAYFSNLNPIKILEIIQKIIEVNGVFYIHLIQKKEEVRQKLEKEINYVFKFIDLSQEKINEYCQKNDKKIIPASEIFLWYDTHGMPLELIRHCLCKNNRDFSREDFNKLLEEQQKRAKKDRGSKNIRVF